MVCIVFAFRRTGLLSGQRARHATNEEGPVGRDPGSTQAMTAARRPPFRLTRTRGLLPADIPARILILGKRLARFLNSEAATFKPKCGTEHCVLDRPDWMTHAVETAAAARHIAPLHGVTLLDYELSNQGVALKRATQLVYQTGFKKQIVPRGSGLARGSAGGNAHSNAPRLPPNWRGIASRAAPLLVPTGSLACARPDPSSWPRFDHGRSRNRA